MGEEKLEDIFSGVVELTAGQRAYVMHLLEESYMNGGWTPEVGNRRDFYRRIARSLLGPLKLTRMVTPDGCRLVSVAEHEAIVAEIERGRQEARDQEARDEETRDGSGDGPELGRGAGAAQGEGHR